MKISMKYFASAVMLSMFSGLSAPAHAVDGNDDVGMFGSITLTRQAREAAKAAKQGQWAAAESGFKKAYDQDPKAVDLNYGIYNAAARNNDWQQATSALEEIFQAQPSSKQHLLTEYGQCLALAGRSSEAVPVLKSALASVDADANFMANKVRELMTKVEKVIVKEKIPLTPEQLRNLNDEVADHRPVSIPYTDPGETTFLKSKKALTYENAYKYAEFIGICTYLGYDHSDGISFNHPPLAHFKIDKVLKGHKLNKTLPVRFEFNDKANREAPKDWKFDEDKMPAKNSKWIIFTEMAIPTNGAYDTYRGNYGRQEATEANLDELYKVIELHRGQQ